MQLQSQRWRTGYWRCCKTARQRAFNISVPSYLLRFRLDEGDALDDNVLELELAWCVNVEAPNGSQERGRALIVHHVPPASIAQTRAQERVSIGWGT
jgi:hypothetical protein